VRIKVNIRRKLTLIFFSIVIVVVTAISLSIYYFSASYREADFYRRLKNRAINTAKVLIEFKEVNAGLLRRIEQNNPASLPNQFIIIYNDRNEVLYSSHHTNLIPIDALLLGKVRSDHETKFHGENYEGIGFLYNEGADQFTVIASATDVYGWKALTNLRNILLVIFLICIFLVSSLGWFYAGKVLKPISDIVEKVGNVSETNLNQRLEVENRHDELGKLATTFNEMLERLENAFDAQKNFIANASHEIKTPITVMSTQIEVALLQKRHEEQYETVLKSVLGSLKRLNILSTQLLLLAQTTGDRVKMSFEPFRIDDIIWDIKEELLKIYPDSKIEIQLSEKLSHESLLLNGDEQLMKVALMNLVDNGYKYSNDGSVVITLNTVVNEEITVQLMNNGKGISPEVGNKIFDLFFRGNSEKKIKGFGIGLPLVKRIISLHGGTISFESLPNVLTRFTLKLPVRA
jgi:signal transduction histidine kinase